MSGGGSVHPLESQYDSQVSTVSNTPDTSHTDHVTDFNNKFRHFHPEMLTEAGPLGPPEAPEPIFPNNNPPPCGPGYCAGAGGSPPSGYPLLHLPSIPQHHLAGKLLRDVYIHYNITTNTLGLGCPSCVRSESLQPPGYPLPGPQPPDHHQPQEPPVTSSKRPRLRPGPPALYNSEVIQHLRSNDNLVCDV